MVLKGEWLSGEGNGAKHVIYVSGIVALRN